MSFRHSLSVAFLLIGHSLAYGQILLPTNVKTVIPPGSNDTSNPFTDDVLLESITFDGQTYFVDGGQVVSVRSAYVSQNRRNVNAEFGDRDTGSDGNPDPFTRIGLDPAQQESTDPAFQDQAIVSSFSTNSLVEGVDGETNYTLRLTFDSGIIDNFVGADTQPEILLFERGNNDRTTVRAITGGSFEQPEYAPNTVLIGPNVLEYVGINIDTKEITGAQGLFAGGIDADSFGTTDTIWGIEISSRGGDFYGSFISADEPAKQLDPNVPTTLINPQGTTAPEPSTLLCLALAANLLLLRRRE